VCVTPITSTTLMSPFPSDEAQSHRHGHRLVHPANDLHIRIHHHYHQPITIIIYLSPSTQHPPPSLSLTLPHNRHPHYQSINNLLARIPSPLADLLHPRPTRPGSLHRRCHTDVHPGPLIWMCRTHLLLLLTSSIHIYTCPSAQTLMPSATHPLVSGAPLS
jgi:hypothetical protein